MRGVRCGGAGMEGVKRTRTVRTGGRGAPGAGVRLMVRRRLAAGRGWMLTYIRLVQLDCGSWSRFMSYPVNHRRDEATATVGGMERVRLLHMENARTLSSGGVSGRCPKGEVPGRCPKGGVPARGCLLAPVPWEARASGRAVLSRPGVFYCPSPSSYHIAGGPVKEAAGITTRVARTTRSACRGVCAPRAGLAPCGDALPGRAIPCHPSPVRATPARVPAVRVAQPPHSGHRDP